MENDHKEIKKPNEHTPFIEYPCYKENYLFSVFLQANISYNTINELHIGGYFAALLWLCVPVATNCINMQKDE